ncbi:hypothetical protein FALBO_10323 [Fusarium albosuccineum]|uniref:Uncharacterized protein n=1 Tax=Fusarium albosuccineum TaxID=1237068 RepID=A0A8H4L7T5_9HYPO|nr:hypothetical protein FALBO_10323 [Fusarium albosuccineum]
MSLYANIHESEEEYFTCLDSKHFYFTDTCDICEEKLEPCSDDVVLVYSKRFPFENWKTATKKYTGLFFVYQNDGVCFCRRGRGDALAGNATAHKECFQRVVGESPTRETLNLLGRTLTWRRVEFAPLEEKLPILPIETPKGFPTSILRYGGQKIGMPSLGNVPPEVAVFIQKNSSGAAFWRVLKGLSLRIELAGRPKGTDQVSVPLTDIVAWNRGNPIPEYTANQHPLKLVRITLDSRGISRVERLTEHQPALSARQSSVLRFVIVDEWRIEGIIMLFKDGLAWLKLPRNHPGLQVWDTPTPPRALPYLPGKADISQIQKLPKETEFSLDYCNMFDTLVPAFSHFNVTRLKGATGVTFVYNGGVKNGWMVRTCRLEAIHPHTRERPNPSSIDETPLRFSSAYLPLAAGDEILGVDIYKDMDQISFTFVTKLAGIVHVGLQPTVEAATRLSSALPDALIWDQYSLAMRPIIGIYPDRENNEVVFADRSTPLIITRNNEPRLSSWAPLGGIRRVQVYYLETRNGTEYFKGMLIEYESGVQRSVRECTLDIRHTRTWINPTRVSFAQKNISLIRQLPLERTYLEFDTNPATLSPELDWKTCDLDGSEVHFQYAYAVSTKVEVLPAGSWRQFWPAPKCEV